MSEGTESRTSNAASDLLHIRPVGIIRGRYGGRVYALLFVRSAKGGQKNKPKGY